MSDIRRHVHNAGKLLLMGVVFVVGWVVIATVLLWPAVLWWQFNQPYVVALSLTIIWVVALLK